MIRPKPIPALSEKAIREVHSADQWARGMREWMREKGTWKEKTE